MSIFNKFTVAMSVVALSAVGGGFMSTVHADNVKQDTNVVKTASVDKTSEGAITEKAKLVILGVDNDGKAIPTGEERITYLKAQNYDYQKVQDILKARNFERKQPTELTIYYGKIKCADCGNTLTRKKGRSKIYYYCSSYVRNNTCTSHGIKEEQIEAIVLQLIKQLK